MIPIAQPPQIDPPRKALCDPWVWCVRIMWFGSGTTNMLRASHSSRSRGRFKPRLLWSRRFGQTLQYGVGRSVQVFLDEPVREGEAAADALQQDTLFGIVKEAFVA